MTYLTSSEALRRLCETQPPQPIRGGIKSKIVGGLGIAGTALGAYFHNWTLSHPGRIAAYSAITLLGLYGLYKIYDIVTSSLESKFPHREDGRVRFRNDGYSTNSYILLRRFSDVVHPIDTGDELRTHTNLFLNGVTLNEIKFTRKRQREVTRDGRKVTITEQVPVFRTEILGDPLPIGYSASIVGEFHGKRILAKAGNSALAKSLANIEVGDALYLQGFYSTRHAYYLLPKGTVELEEVGRALTR